MFRQKYTVLIERPIMVGFHAPQRALKLDAESHCKQVNFALKMARISRKAHLVKSRNPSPRTVTVRVVTRLKDEDAAAHLHNFLHKHSHVNAGVRVISGVHTAKDLEPATWRTRRTVLRTASPTIPVPW
jgi:hypothetical protein